MAWRFSIDVEADAIRDQVEFVAGASITAKAGGATVQIQDESDIDAIMRDAGGRLISIQPVKQSLEDLFIAN